MKIRCDNGLCDRLRFIFSYIQSTRKTDTELTVCWLNNIKCNGWFVDYFHPIKDVIFTTDINHCDVFDWKPCPGFDPKDLFIYKELLLLPHMEEKINHLAKTMANFIAVHVRRTDKVTYNGIHNLTSDQTFFNFIENNPDYNVFLASDNAESQEIFKKRYGKKIFCSSQIVPTESFRKTSLEIAIIDLFLCIKSKKFLGTNLSGFSDMIYQFHKERSIIKML